MPEQYFIIEAEKRKHKSIEQILKKNNYFFKKAVEDFIIVVGRNPEKDLAFIRGIKIFPTDDPSTYNLCEEVQFLKEIQTSKIKVGDSVRVVDEKSPYFNATGVVNSIQDKKAEVLVAVWGIASIVTLNVDDLERVV